MTPNECLKSRDITDALYTEFNWLFTNNSKYARLINIVDDEIDGFEQKIRKQVVEKIKSKVKELIDNKDFGLCNHEYANGFCYGLQFELAKILDQVERSEKDE